jgi:hypothetical protein
MHRRHRILPEGGWVFLVDRTLARIHDCLTGRLRRSKRGEALAVTIASVWRWQFALR